MRSTPHSWRVKSRIPNPKSQTKPDFKEEMTKTTIAKVFGFAFLGSFVFVWDFGFGIWDLG
jgi:SecE/Sec61-gamma subunits of protein translocation complex